MLKSLIFLPKTVKCAVFATDQGQHLNQHRHQLRGDVGPTSWS